MWDGAGINIENSDDDEVDITPSILIAPTVLTRDISSITTLTAQHKRQKKQKKHWSQILPPSSIQSRSSRKPTARFESQNARDIAAAEMKEQRRKEREAKVNRTGTGRTKKAEPLAETSQLLDGLEFPFRSSQYRIIWHTKPPYSTRPPPPIRPSPGVSKVGPTYYKTMVLYY
jgi:hypothetical protein